MSLESFNLTDRNHARNTSRPCVDIDRWVDIVVDARPYSNVEDVLRVAREAAHPWSEAEIDAALAHHPRIGEQAGGASDEAAHSRTEQSAIDHGDDDVTVALATGNRAYEDQFDRVFLIRALGRSSGEILESLNHRLLNSPEEEIDVVRGQLREIALLRLEGILNS